ncbi:MAG: TlpA disulfide reductase family protein [Sediminibacterium sp.]
MQFKRINSFLIFVLIAMNSYCQNKLSGNFSSLKGQIIRLVGFNGLGIYKIDSTVISNQGFFSLKYSEKDFGMGYISSADNKPYFVVLAKEQIELKGEMLSVPESILVINGNENKNFVNYATEHAKREQALSAWGYLQKKYQEEPLFSNEKIPLQTIALEVQRIKKQDLDFLSNLPAKSYVSWYLPLRKLISAVSSVAQFKANEIPATISAFRNIDYADSRFYKSGLLRDAIESQYWLLENSGMALDSIFNGMNLSTDYILKSISKNEILFNEMTKYLFDYFEKHSLYKASEYLAVKALTQNGCTLNIDLAKQLEFYRAMKKGAIAPDILFSGDVYKNGENLNKSFRLSEINSKYKLVIFGASWCNLCIDEMSQLLSIYSKWKLKGVEVFFVSMDTDKKAYLEFTSLMPFISNCDYKKWDTKAAKDYYISGSPTFFLLDSKQKILLRPISVKQINSFLELGI